MKRAWCALALAFAIAAPAAAQMDPRMMAGQSIPSGDLPAGTVTVRVVREQIGNNVEGVQVELHGAGPVRTAVTNAEGRAEFSGMPVGARLHAVAVVGEERLESLPFDVPSAGGVRTLLVAGVGVGTPLSEEEAAAPPTASTAPSSGGAGPLVLGNNTRIAIEFQEDTPTVFYLLDIVNRSSAPVSLDSALIFDLPAGALGATVLEGGSPMANARADRVTVSGPFPPGVTSLPIAFRIEPGGATLELTQTFPLPLDQVAMAVQRVGELRVSSPQAPQVRDASLQGTAFLIANGPALAAGTPLQVTLSGLPHHSRVPLYVALAISAGIVVWAVRLGAPERGKEARQRQELEARRERGLTALAALEAERRAGRVTEELYASRRATLLQQLDRVYGALDADGTLPGGGQGLAA